MKKTKKNMFTFWEGLTAFNLHPKENQNTGIFSTKQTYTYE